MTAVNCPMCELRFTNKNERDWHLRNEHEHLHVHRPTERPTAWRWHTDPARAGDQPAAPEDDPRTT
ncbi:MAG TPA: hypothetical protein VI357_25220 [Mycobacteriales bacterium]